jgi:hypothetical protein
MGELIMANPKDGMSLGNLMQALQRAAWFRLPKLQDLNKNEMNGRVLFNRQNLQVGPLKSLITVQ